MTMHEHIPVHPIIEALRRRRIAKRMTLTELGKQVKINRNTLYQHEEFKCTSLDQLDRWAKALGYQIALIDLEGIKSTRKEPVNALQEL